MRMYGAAYDPQTLKLMEQVFEEVCEDLKTLDLTQAYADAKNTVAIRIAAAVAEGERDPKRLRLWALNAVDADAFERPSSTDAVASIISPLSLSA